MLVSFRDLGKILSSLFNNKKYYGFSLGHSYLNSNQIENVYGLLHSKNNNPVYLFEETFSNEIGGGKCVSFAAGRMGFYALMQSLGIGYGDEVILLGHTCSVMPNAVLRIGATPIFSDIDRNTIGSCYLEIEKKITSKTKMIVAQHSFGIPCDIEPIVRLSKSKNIFLLEDCALTLGSKIKGIQVGNFGDAALFSFDSYKPLNATAGGIIYTQNSELYSLLKTVQKSSGVFSAKMHDLIWKKFLFENKFFNPDNYRKSFIQHKLKRIFSGNITSYLTDDYGKKASSSYPYPANLPVFLGQLGLLALQYWKEEKNKRKSLLKDFLEISHKVGLAEFIPKKYYCQNVEIIPLRFVYTHNHAKSIIKKMSDKINVNSFWFKKPIIACNNPADFGYNPGDCPISEKTCKDIINWPCVFNDSDKKELLNTFNIVHIK